MKIIDLYVVTDNADPYNASRVRAYPLSLFNRTASDPIQIVKDQDANAKYKPWKQADTYEGISDPYCFEPFLPKHINLIPKVGDLVKVIAYDTGNANTPKEYLVVNSTINNIRTETYRSADKFHQNNSKRSDLDNTRELVPGYNPSYGDLALTSGKNSDLILNDGRIVLKVGHQTQSDTGVKQINSHQGIFSLSQFKTGYTYQDQEVDIVRQTRITINSIIEYRLFDYVNNNMMVNGESYAYGFAINFKFLTTPEYSDTIASLNIESFDLEMIGYFNDAKKFVATFKKILGQFDKKELDYIIDDTQFTKNSNDGILYKIFDRRSPVGGVMPDKSLNVGQRFYIRGSKNQENISTEGNKLLSNLGSAIDSTGGYIRPKPTTTNIKSKTKSRKLTQTGNPESTITLGSDNVFLLSWKKNDYATLNNKEYITQEMIYNNCELMDTTEPLVRGNQMLVVISKLIDLFLNHGHKDITDSRNTIDNITIEDLNKVKSTILNIKTIEKQLSIEGKDINDAIINLINHNLRIN